MKASPIPKSHLTGFGTRFIASLRVGGLLAFGILLWCVNFLPVQRPVLVCECSVLVSASQEGRIEELSRKAGIESPMIDWLSCQGVIGGPRLQGETQEGVPVRRVQMRVGLHRRVSIVELEAELDRLLEESGVAGRIRSIEDTALPELRWRLRVAEHALTRFELDRDRGSGQQSERTAAPFRLVSQSSTELGESQQALYESLRSKVEAARSSLAAAESEAAVRDRERRSVFTMVGYPRFILGGDRLSSFRALMLFFLGCSVIGMVASRWGKRRTIGSVWDSHGAVRHSRRPVEHSEGRHLEWMSVLKRHGIPYLGLLTIEGQTEERAELTLPSGVQPTRRFTYFGMRLSVLARWSDRILFLWIACFVWRYLVDSLWRELLFRAPLAAFSSVLFGI